MALVLAAQIVYSLVEGIWKWPGAIRALESARLAAARFLRISGDGPGAWILDADLLGNLVYAVSLAVFGAPFVLVTLAVWTTVAASRHRRHLLVGWLALLHACTLPLLICLFSRVNRLFDSPPLAWHAAWFDWQIGMPSWQSWILPGLFIAEAIAAITLIRLGASAPLRPVAQ